MNDTLQNSLAALLSNGLESLKTSTYRALRKDDVSVALKEANEEYAKKGPKDLDAALTYALILISRDLTEEAMNILRKVAEFHGHEPTTQLAQIDALLAKGDDEAARALMEGMSHVVFQDTRHLAYLGDLFMDAGEELRAFEMYMKALDQGSTDAEVASKAALLLGASGRAEEAAAMYERAADFDPEDPEHWFLAAESWMEVEEFKYAADAYKRVLKFDEENPRLWLFYGVALSEAGELHEALKAFDKARKLEPDEAEHWLNCAHLLMELGDMEAARRHYEKAALINPEDPEAVNGMVAAAFELGDVELAETLAKRAILMDPENPDSVYNLGVIQLAMNHTKDAEATFRTAITIDPDDPRYLSSLAMVLLRKSEVSEALQMAEQAHSQPEFDATSAFEFTRDLMRFGGADHVLGFVGKVATLDPRWEAIRPLFEFLALALRRKEDGTQDRLLEFIAAIKEMPELIPIEWDFEEIERLATGLESGARDVLEMMVAVLEGRKELSQLESKAA